jgi:hypothetical protein
MLPVDDPRVDEMRALGVQPVWLRVAEVIGVEVFLALWRILDAEATRNDDQVINPTLISYRRFLRHQRNRYIEALSAQGRTSAEIRARVAADLGETLYVSHIYRITRRAKG